MDDKMGSKVKKQRKLIQILSAPVKILRKTGDLYVKSVEYFANQVSYGASAGCPTAPSMPLPKSLSVNPFPTACNDEEFGQLLRVKSKMETKQTGGLQTRTFPRSYSVSVGKIGRIEEEGPCSFEESDLKSELLYPRSRSHAFRSNFVYK